MGNTRRKMQPRFITAAAEIGEGYNEVNREFATQCTYPVKLPG